MAGRPLEAQDRSMEDVQVHGAHPGIDGPAPAVWPLADGSTWLTALRAAGPLHDEAVGWLYELLVRGARSEIGRRWANVGYVDDDAVDEIATQAADDALLALLSKLDDYRGDSRFTTWACKLAILEAGTRARLRGWDGRDVVLDSDGWKRLAGPAARTDAGTGYGDLLEAVAHGIDTGLTRHQRRVLVALAIDRVPIDVLADRLNTTRGALYATLHDARRQLRDAIADQGLSCDQP
jgi:RNA polymerase sigma-70 factor (ECF subfamily)